MVGGGGTALRDFVSDAVGNATQDANYKGFYLPFYTVGTGAGASWLAHVRHAYQWSCHPSSAVVSNGAMRAVSSISAV